MWASVREFPANHEFKSGCGLPWGLLVQPLHEEVSLPFEGGPLASDLERCADCAAYVNGFCSFEKNRSWRCSLCGHSNELDNDSRLAHESRSTQPELANGCVEFRVDPPSAAPPTFADVPIFVAVVDLRGFGKREHIEAVRDGLNAALEALPPTALFGLVTFGERVGVFDLAGATPHVRQLPIIDGAACRVSLDELLPLQRFVVQVSKRRESIARAIELLPALASDAPHGAFGAAVKLLVDLFAVYDSLHVRLLCFVAGSPNYGPGSLADVPAEVLETQLAPRVKFYADLASAAVAAGVCCDLLALRATDAALGLANISPLATLTGGRIVVYQSEDNFAGLPQDIYRWASEPMAFHCVLRLRTTPEFQAMHTYGLIYADPKLEGLYHLQACDPCRAIAFDFAFHSQFGFSGARVPTVQMAFAYSYLPPASAGETARARIERRLRVHTRRFAIASASIDAIFRSADPCTIAALLAHKLTQSALTSSATEASARLIDWYAILAIHYSEQQRQPEGQRVVDLLLRAYPNLILLPRLLYGLHKSPLLKPEALTADSWIFLRHVLCELEPSSAARMIYPALSSYSTPDAVHKEFLPLSLSSIMNGEQTLFLLDGFLTIFVYCSDLQRNDWPPPRGSLMRTHVDHLKKYRSITPKVIVFKAGTSESDEQQLHAHLIEDSPEDNMDAFFRACNQEIAKVLK